jgi:glycosyltransferase involved in cell wall biosynthesis
LGLPRLPRVVLDGRWIRVDSGIGQYAYWLARTIPQVAPDLELEVWVPDSDDALVRDLRARESASLQVHTLGNPRRLGSSLRATFQLLARGQALYHSPDWIGVPALPGFWSTVVTIHDLIPLVAPEWVPHSLKARHPHIYRAAIRTIVRSASAVLTDTPPWAAEIEKYMDLAPRRLHVVPLGVAEPEAVTAEQVRATRERFGLGDDPIVLTVGRPEPYKGLASVIRAFARARRNERLVIVGMKDARYSFDREEVGRLGLEGRVIFTGSIDPQTLECLYRSATVFFTMSRFEGFGLCPLEAMARRVPVLAARTSVTDYTIGNAALSVEPDDEPGAASALRNLLDDPMLRERLAQAGRELATLFTWESCARGTANVYRRVFERAHVRRDHPVRPVASAFAPAAAVDEVGDVRVP